MHLDVFKQLEETVQRIHFHSYNLSMEENDS